MSDVLERADALSSVISEGRSFAEVERRLLPEVVDACREAGMFGLGAPLEVGGLEASPVETFDALQRLAMADPSVAWYAVNSTPLGRAAAWLDERFWSDIYAPLGNFGFSAAVTAAITRKDGGFVLTGQWPLMTGVMDARWALVYAMYEDDGTAPMLRAVVVETSQLDVTPVWDQATAMRGTGSHKVAAQQVAIDPGLVLDLSVNPRIDRPLYRTGLFVPVGYGNAGVPIGILRAALQSVASELHGKVSRVFGHKAEQSTAILELVAEANLALDHLDYGVRGAAQAVWDHALRSEVAPPRLRASVIGGQFHAAEVARDLISRLYARTSSAAFFEGHQLERALRDIHAVAYGFEPLRPLLHEAGRISIGFEPRIPGY